MPSNKYQTKDNNQKNDPQEQGFKQIMLQIFHCLLRSNQSIHNIFYYILMVIQFLQIFYYITHPFFPYYKNSIIMINIQNFLKYLVFNEFLINDSNIYKVVSILILIYILIQGILFFVIMFEVKEKKLVNQTKKIYLIANIMFQIFNSILTIPAFGIALNIVYCDPTQNKYTLGQNCYQGIHIPFCFVAGYILFTILAQQGVNWYIFYNKNPFGTDFLSKYENNAVIGKFLLKIIPVLYIAVDFRLTYIDVFAFAITACFCGYLFFFRIFAYHDYNQFNFYFVLFLEVILAWFSINNNILSYLDTQKKAGGLFQSFLCSIFVAALVIQIQQESYKKIFMEGMQADKVKKQNVQKFLYRLIYMFSCSQSQNEKNHLQTVIKMLNSKFEVCVIQAKGSHSKGNKKLQKKFYGFLSKFLHEYLQSNSNIMLMAVNCNLLIFQEKFSYAFHQSLQLSNKKISLIQELMMYRFRRHPRYDKQKLDTTKKQNNNIFMMYYDFNQNLMRLQQQISLCALNNLDYWQEVCEANPSIYKIRNLAEKYEDHTVLIDNYYNKIYEIFPNNKLALKSYIQFLMYIGVNIKNLSKARQRYEQAQQNIKKTKQLERDSGNLIQMGQNQNLAYISIQTSQLNLGIITNCNSQFKKMLGYQKHELLSKKVNKIMPKAFNQFHDNIVRNYIQKKQHNQKNKVERVVYALNKDNYLVQVVLFTKVNYKTIGEKSGLELIGFLKKIQDPNKALIILEMNSSNIVGANAGFAKLIQDGVSNSQFANSQIKINTLLPNLSSTLIEQGKVQQTCLIFSSSVIVTKSGLNLEVKKKVLIQVQHIRQYSNKIKLAYLLLKQIQSEQNEVKNEQRVRKATYEIIKLSQKKNQNKIQTQAKSQNHRKVKMLSSQVSIMQEISRSQSLNTFQEQTVKLTHSSADKDQQVFTMIQRKKQQFLKNQHLDIFRYILWLTLIVFVLVTMGVFIYQIILNMQLIDTSGQIKSQLMNSYVITYETAQINKYVEKVMQGNSYNLSEFTENSDKLSKSISNFQSNFIPLMTMSVKYDFPLQLNQFRYYDVVIQKQQDNPGYAEQTIIDAFFQYISSSKNYATYSLADVTVDAIHQLVEQNDFIQQNGKQLFPSVSKKMSYQYIDLGQYMYKAHQTKQLIVTVSYGSNLILALVLIAILIRKINTFNETIVSLYNQIKLWDANQMKHKCVKFIQKNSTVSSLKTYSKRRISSLLNLFPHEALLKVLQSSTPKGQNKSSGHNLSHSGEDQQLLKSQTPLNQNKQESTSRITQKQRKFYVVLGEKNKLKKKFTIFSIIAFTFIALYFVKYIFSHQIQRSTLRLNKSIGQVGRVRDNLAFINYYTYKLMLESNDTDYRRLLKDEIAQFYKNTDQCYNLIEKSSSVLKDSYSLVEQITALIFSSNLNISDSQRYNIRNEKYLLQELLFQKNIASLSKIINKNIQQDVNEVYNEIKSLNLIFSLVYIFVTILFAIIIKCWMLEEILRNSKKSKSMILMLPPWLIQRNNKILNVFK